MSYNFDIIKSFSIDGKEYYYYSIPDLENYGFKVSRLPRSLRIVLESMIRNVDNVNITEEDIINLLQWNARAPANQGIPFRVARVLMQDFTGVPAVVDLAVMRNAVAKMGKDPLLIQPQVPVDLVIDHSVQVDFYGTSTAFELNVLKEFERNEERYKFLKWSQKAFNDIRIIPPDTGIVHQVNLEYLAKVVVVREKNGKNFVFPDTLVGTDSHTTMINGLGVVGWGVGGIEAEAAILNQPITFPTPYVVGVHLYNTLQEGVTATDLVLTLTKIFRDHNVVGKFIEFFGEGVKHLSVPDRATISNMCPEYGATLALFPVDDETLKYLELTGRDQKHIAIVKKYLELEKLFGNDENVEYSEIIEFDLASVEATVAGPRLPHQKINLGNIKESVLEFLKNGDYKSNATINVPIMIKNQHETLSNGDIVIAAITSCTNTSNPEVMIAAGLVAKKAYEKGLHINPKVKTSLAPGSRVVAEYLKKSGLQKYLDALGFNVVAYGCTTCIGNSGPLDPAISKAIREHNIVTAAVLSGNRNFEARVHREVRVNYLMSPPLVVAFAIAGKVTINLKTEPLGTDRNGNAVFLKDIWPTNKEIYELINNNISRKMYLEKYQDVYEHNSHWNKLDTSYSVVYAWDEKSTYIAKAPFFDQFDITKFNTVKDIANARPLLVLGDAVTTDHISPAGTIPEDSPAGKYLLEHGVAPAQFNTYGSRRGNHEVMIRGTFANPRIKNKLVNKSGGYTVHYPDMKEMTVYDAAMLYMREHVPLIIFAGEQYGTGSSRDWAAKGTLLLGIKAVIAKSYERIHRSNLIGMGILPLQFMDNTDLASIGADLQKPFTIRLPEHIKPNDTAEMIYTDRVDGTEKSIKLKIRLDIPIEVEYYNNGGILQYALRKILS